MRRLVKNPLTAASAIILIISLAVSVPASAAGQRHLVNQPAVCRWQGHLSGTLWYPGPYGWFCYDAAFTPPFIAPAGGLDMNGWCSYKYPGTHAQLLNRLSPDGWYCVD